MPTTAVTSTLCFVAIIGLIVAVVRHFTELRARELHEEVDLWRGRYFAMKEKHLRRASVYWMRRQDASLYANNGTVMEMARRLAPDALTMLDVGSHEGSFISEFSWIPTKVATDLQFLKTTRRAMASTRGVAFLEGDFLKLNFGPTVFDLVICTEVVEHLPDRIAKRFIRKMMRLAKVLIVATSLELPAGAIAGHIQDPLSAQEFRSWFKDPKRGVNGSIVEFVAERARINHPERPFLRLPSTGRKLDDFVSLEHQGKRIPVWNQIVAWSRGPSNMPIRIRRVERR